MEGQQGPPFRLFFWGGAFCTALHTASTVHRIDVAEDKLKFHNFWGRKMLLKTQLLWRLIYLACACIGTFDALAREIRLYIEVSSPSHP